MFETINGTFPSETSADERRTVTRRSWSSGDRPIAIPHEAAATASTVVVFKDDLLDDGTADGRRSVAEVAALEILAVARQHDVGRAHAGNRTCSSERS